MKKLFVLSIIILTAALSSCDKVENPIRPSVELDTNLFPGNWQNYIYPVFTQNTNTNRNILLEDYTGHNCPNCPAAATAAADLESANPGRVFVASIHAGPGGLTSFQNLAADCGTAANPTNKYCTVFYNDESLAYGTEFQSGFGFIGNPAGNISRITFGSDMFFSYTEWPTYVSQTLTENNLKINLQAHTNYYPETNGLFLHVEAEFLEDLTSDYNLVVYVIENEIIDYQNNMSTPVPDYHHHNTFRGCIDQQAWGQSIPGEHQTGEKSYFDYSYALPSGQNNTEFHLLIYVYDVATYEILQVIKKEI